MVIMTAKLSKPKLIAALLILIAVVLMTVIILSGPSSSSASPDAGEETSNAATNDDRLAYLSSFGWTVNGDPVQMEQVRIPDTPSEVFDRYNELQLSQGFDLTQYAGKTVSRYVYEIENAAEQDAPTYATLLVYENHVIGGDVSSAAPDGVMHGFAKPS